MSDSREISHPPTRPEPCSFVWLGFDEYNKAVRDGLDIFDRAVQERILARREEKRQRFHVKQTTRVITT